MADPAILEPEGLEILLARDLRKAGLEIGRVRRSELDRSDDGSGDYRLALTVELLAPAPARLVVEGRRSAAPIGASGVHALAMRIAEASHDTKDAGGPRNGSAAPVSGLLLATAGFETGALAAASTADVSIALLRAADARAAFDSSGWGPAGQYPIWLPEHLLELAERGPTGTPTYRIVDEDSADRLLSALGLGSV